MIARFGTGGEPPVSLTTSEYPPGAVTEPRSEPDVLYGYIVEGELEIELVDRTVLLTEGDSVALGRGEAHSLRNPGTDPARAVWFRHGAAL